MTDHREIRLQSEVAVESRAGNTHGAIVGYAAVFESPTVIDGNFIEVISRGAFAAALQRDDIHAVYNHSYDLVLGRKKAGTLQIEEDDHGLRIAITPPDTTAARDLMANIAAGNIDQMSFAFTMQGGEQRWDESGDMPKRTIARVGSLIEVSIVPRGAYPDTVAALRSLEAHRKEQKTSNFNAAATRHRMKMNLRLRAENG